MDRESHTQADLSSDLRRAVTRASIRGPYQTRALEVLAQWLAVERALAGVDAGTPESDDLRAESFRLRDEYQALILAARHNDAPEPPPFPLE